MSADPASQGLRRLRVAIVTRDRFRSPRYLALGLQRMLRRLDVQADCFLHGIGWLDTICNRQASRRHRLKAALADVWLQYLRRYDLIIVSDTVGLARDTALLALLRRLGKPLFFYEVFALAGSRHFLDRFPPDAVSQFDAYLVSSAIHDDTPVNGPPIFEIGLELLEAPTQRRERPALAMIDFERQGYERERAEQLAALRAVGMPDFSLQGEYSFSEIVTEYQRTSVAFLAFPEAFGVPIAQLQNQGALIASPQRHWAKRHALLPAGSVFQDDAPFTENFIFYDGEQDLAQQLQARVAGADPAAVAQRFRTQQPHLAEGRLPALREALLYAQDCRPPR